VRLVRTILELDRRGVRGALSGSCPLPGTEWASWAERQQKQYQKQAPEDLLAIVEREWAVLLRRRGRRKGSRPLYSRAALAAFWLLKAVRELERRRLRSTLSNRCPLLGADVDRSEMCARRRLARLSTDVLLATVQRDWEAIL
jgi:hypothetical protein